MCHFIKELFFFFTLNYKISSSLQCYLYTDTAMLLIHVLYVQHCKELNTYLLQFFKVSLLLLAVDFF